MSVVTVRRQRLGPKVQLRTPRDRRAQIKCLIVLMRAIVKPVRCRARASAPRFMRSPNAMTVTSSRTPVFRGKRHFVRQAKGFDGSR